MFFYFFTDRTANTNQRFSNLRSVSAILANVRSIVKGKIIPVTVLLMAGKSVDFIFF